MVLLLDRGDSFSTLAQKFSPLCHVEDAEHALQIAKREQPQAIVAAEGHGFEAIEGLRFVAPLSPVVVIGDGGGARAARRALQAGAAAYFSRRDLHGAMERGALVRAIVRARRLLTSAPFVWR